MAGIQRIEIGFEGGPVIELRVDDDALGRIREGLGSEGFRRVETEDGDIDLDLGRVAFVRTAAITTKVGF